MIRLVNVTKTFGPVLALDDISLKVPSGKITILAGADGSGKSTLLKILIGLIPKGSGEIFLKDRKLGTDFQQLRNICGYMPENFSLYSDLSVEENLNFFANLHSLPRSTREQQKDNLLTKTGLINFKNRRAQALSGGMKQKLALCTILLAAPELIILDEPTTGVDPLSRIEFLNIIQDLKAQGKTILISTPYLDEAEQGDHVAFFHRGKLLLTEQISRLKQEFPPKLFKIRPRERIFSVLERIKQDPNLAKNCYAKGPFIHYLQTGGTAPEVIFPSDTIVEISPGLEDIYLYYERKNAR